MSGLARGLYPTYVHHSAACISSVSIAHGPAEVEETIAAWKAAAKAM